MLVPTLNFRWWQFEVILIWVCSSPFPLGQVWNGRGDIESALPVFSVAARLTKFSSVSTAPRFTWSKIFFYSTSFVLLHLASTCLLCWILPVLQLLSVNNQYWKNAVWDKAAWSHLRIYCSFLGACN